MVTVNPKNLKVIQDGIGVDVIEDGIMVGMPLITVIEDGKTEAVTEYVLFVEDFDWKDEIGFWKIFGDAFDWKGEWSGSQIFTEDFSGWE